MECSGHIPVNNFDLKNVFYKEIKSIKTLYPTKNIELREDLTFYHNTPVYYLRKIRIISYNGRPVFYYGSVPIFKVEKLREGGNSVVYKCTYVYYNKEKHFAFRMDIDGEEEELLEI